MSESGYPGFEDLQDCYLMIFSVELSDMANATLREQDTQDVRIYRIVADKFFVNFTDNQLFYSNILFKKSSIFNE